MVGCSEERNKEWNLRGSMLAPYLLCDARRAVPTPLPPRSRRPTIVGPARQRGFLDRDLLLSEAAADAVNFPRIVRFSEKPASRHLSLRRRGRSRNVYYGDATPKFPGGVADIPT